MDFMAHDSYDLFVLDCASTGHLVRLLEMPDLINQWLKAFFSLFLKYEHILQMPGFVEELVVISRNLKKLRELLRNPAASALYAVGIPTLMALEETKDLVAACDRMGIAVSRMFLNLLTTPCNCHLCVGLRRRELTVARARRAVAVGKAGTEPLPARRTGDGRLCRVLRSLLAETRLHLIYANLRKVCKAFRSARFSIAC
jgi:anion-transporting  ArsA/GET3 family ATPase